MDITELSMGWVGPCMGWIGLGQDFQFLVGWVGSTIAKVLKKIRNDYVNAFKARLQSI